MDSLLAIPSNNPPDFFTPAPSTTSAAAEMEASVSAVERILDYRFRNKRLLEEALTHSSCTDSASYERLEFVGDAALGLAFSKYLFLEDQTLEPGQLTLLRAANVSREKLARVAVRHGLYGFVRRNHATALDDTVREFADVVSQEQEDNAVAHGGSMKAPKILSDIIESVAAAVYVDVNFDLEKLWMVIKGLLEPIVTLGDLHKQPQPVTLLYELCQSQGKQVDIIFSRNEMETTADVYIDDEFFVSGSSEEKEIAKLNAARTALSRLSQSVPAHVDMLQNHFDMFGIEGAKQKLNEICTRKKWSKPGYKIEKKKGPAHEKKFVCSVQITASIGTFYKKGDEKMRVKEAKNSAAASMLRALQQSAYL